MNTSGMSQADVCVRAQLLICAPVTRVKHGRPVFTQSRVGGAPGASRRSAGGRASHVRIEVILHSLHLEYCSCWQVTAGMEIDPHLLFKVEATCVSSQKRDLYFSDCCRGVKRARRKSVESK